MVFEQDFLRVQGGDSGVAFHSVEAEFSPAALFFDVITEGAANDLAQVLRFAFIYFTL